MGEDDLALETLLTVRGELSPTLDEQLLRQCLQVEQRFQFSHDRAQSANAMEKLIDDYVKAQAGAQS